MYFLYFFQYTCIYTCIIILSNNDIIFVLKFGAWRMSVFATDRRYSDNGILVSSYIAAVLHVN
jgi:hypothetical protein